MDWYVRLGEEQKALTLRVAWVNDPSECPGLWASQSESQSQLLDLSLVLLENKISLCSEKKCLCSKDQQGGH